MLRSSLISVVLTPKYFFWPCIHIGLVSPVLYGSNAKYSSHEGGLSKGNPMMSARKTFNFYWNCVPYIFGNCTQSPSWYWFYLYEDPGVPCMRRKILSSGSCRWRPAWPRGCGRRRRRNTRGPCASRSWWSSASLWNDITRNHCDEDLLPFWEELLLPFPQNHLTSLASTSWIELDKQGRPCCRTLEWQ